jgi:molybdenum cofactor cytidylyltransferase
MVRRSKDGHTLLQETLPMNMHPTVIVLAHKLSEWTPSYASQHEAPIGALHAMLCGLLASELPVVLVATPHITNQVRGLLPGNCLVELPAAHAPAVNARPDRFVCAMRAGIQASAQSEGWLVLPSELPELQPGTLRRVASGLRTSPIVYPQYQAQQGQVMGFGRELFSELIRLEHDRDLLRLASRYPSEGVDVNDPGVLALPRHVPPAGGGFHPHHPAQARGHSNWLK